MREVLVVAGVVVTVSNRDLPGRRRQRVLERRSRGGEHGPLWNHAAKRRDPPEPVPFARRRSAHAARDSDVSSSFPSPRRPPSACPSSPRERRRPRKGDAGRVDRRHGSSASSRGLQWPAPAARRNARWRTLGASSQDGTTSFARKLAEARCASTARQRGQERQLRAEEDSRLAGVPARRNALQRSVEWSQPREAVDRLRPARSQRSPVGGGFDEGEHLGRRAARRGCPSALDEKATTSGTSA